MTGTLEPTRTSTVPSRPRSVVPPALRSEWTKLWTLRSTYWTLAAAVVVTVGYAALFAGGVTASAGTSLPYSPLFISLIGINLGQLALAVLGVLVISAEYRTGMIRSSLTAVPQRQRFLLAKLIPFTLVALAAGEVMAFGSFFAAQAVLATEGVATSLAAPGVLRAVLGAGLYLAVSGVFGLAVGALVRNVAGSIAIAVAGLLVVPGLLSVLPTEWGQTVSNYFLSNAGQQVMRLTAGTADTPVGPWIGYGVFCASVAAVLAAAAILLHTRDA